MAKQPLIKLSTDLKSIWKDNNIQDEKRYDYDIQINIYNLMSFMDNSASMSFVLDDSINVITFGKKELEKDNDNINLLYYMIDEKNKKVFPKIKEWISLNSIYNANDINNFIINNIHNKNIINNTIEFKQKMIYDENTETVKMPDHILVSINKQAYYILI